MLNKIVFDLGLWWERVEIKNSIKTALAAIISFYLGLELSNWGGRPDYLIGGLWSVLAAVIVLQPNLGATYKAIANRFLGVLIGSLFGAIFSSLFGAHGIILGLAIFTTVLVCSFLNLKDSYRIACLSVAVIIIPWGVHPELSPWNFAFFRFLDTCIGIVVAAAVAYSVWPSQALTNVRNNIVNLFSLMKQLYQYTFLMPNSFDRKEKAIRDLVTEINDLFSQTHQMLEESKFEFKVKFMSQTVWVDLVSTMETIFDLIIVLRNVFSSELENMLDEKLKQQVKKTAEEIDEAFKILANKLSTNRTDLNIQKLAAAKQALNIQMIRFRQTRTTKKYSLEIVEEYFVFFHSLRAIIQDLIQIDKLMDQLRVEDTL